MVFSSITVVSETEFFSFFHPVKSVNKLNRPIVRFTKDLQTLQEVGMSNDNDCHSSCQVVKSLLSYDKCRATVTVASVKVRTSPVTRGSPYVIFTRSQGGWYAIFEPSPGGPYVIFGRSPLWRISE